MDWFMIISCYLISCAPATLIIGMLDDSKLFVEIASMGLTWPIWVLRRIVIVAIDKFKGD